VLLRFATVEYKSWLVVDTLLNVFLAIAVDNLANAQELTAAEEADEKANELEEEESEDMEEVGYCTIHLHSHFVLLIGEKADIFMQQLESEFGRAK